MSAPKVDVLAWFDSYIERNGRYGEDGIPPRAAVAELIEAAKQSRQALAWAAEMRPDFAPEYELMDAALAHIGDAA